MFYCQGQCANQQHTAMRAFDKLIVMHVYWLAKDLRAIALWVMHVYRVLRAHG